MASIGFNATGIAPSAPREVLPAGDYNVQIVKSEVKPTKAGNGNYLSLELEVLDGDHKGRHLFDILNLWNPNPTAVEIAQRTLSAICHAVGIMEVPDSEILHGRPMQAKVKVDPAKGEYEASNKIAGYGAYMGPMAGGASAAPAGFGAPSFAPPMAPPAGAPFAPQSAPQAPFQPPQAPAQQAPAFAPPMAPAPAPFQPVQQAAPASAPAFVPPAPPFAQPAAPAPQAAPVAPAPAQPPFVQQAPVQAAPVQQAAPVEAPVQAAPVQGAAVPPWAQG